MSFDLTLVVITVGSLVASFVNAAFATGGIYILIAASSSVLPLTAAVPLQSAFAFSSLLARILYFRKHIDWRIIGNFVIGALVGVFVGARIFVSLDEATIATLLGSLLLLLIWLPTPNWKIPFKHPFVIVGALHSFLGTLFGVGVILQPAILRTPLLKLQITSTLAGCLISMDIFKMIGYVYYGFDYLQYIPHILLATIAGFVGTWLGKRVTHLVSERGFRIAFKILITLAAIRLLYRGCDLS
jgi:uncharacterized membrane protein YfcA